MTVATKLPSPNTSSIRLRRPAQHFVVVPDKLDLGVCQLTDVAIQVHPPACGVRLRPEGQGDHGQNARLAAPVGTVENRELRVEVQRQRLDCALVLDLNGFELHACLAASDPRIRRHCRRWRRWHRDGLRRTLRSPVQGFARLHGTGQARPLRFGVVPCVRVPRPQGWRWGGSAITPVSVPSSGVSFEPQGGV